QFDPALQRDARIRSPNIDAIPLDLRWFLCANGQEGFKQQGAEDGREKGAFPRFSTRCGRYPHCRRAYEARESVDLKKFPASFPQLFSIGPSKDMRPDALSGRLFLSRSSLGKSAL